MSRKHVKCVLVGDGAVGKLCFLKTLTTKVFPPCWTPGIFENFLYDAVLTNGQNVSIDFFYTSEFLPVLKYLT